MWTPVYKKFKLRAIHRITDDQGEIAAEADDVMVLFDFNKNEKALFPQWMRQNIQKQES
jgi:acyl-CoA thioester hydrolase